MCSYFLWKTNISCQLPTLKKELKIFVLYFFTCRRMIQGWRKMQFFWYFRARSNSCCFQLSMWRTIFLKKFPQYQVTCEKFPISQQVNWLRSSQKLVSSHILSSGYRLVQRGVLSKVLLIQNWTQPGDLWVDFGLPAFLRLVWIPPGQGGTICW